MEVSNPTIFKIFKNMTASLIQNKFSSKKSFSKDMIKQILDSKSPFFYLTDIQKNKLFLESEFIEYSGHGQEIIKKKESSESCYIIIKGEFVAFEESANDTQILSEGDSFGFDGCLFGICEYNIATFSQQSALMKISKHSLESLLHPGEQFTIILGSILLDRQRIFNSGEKFRDYVADCVKGGEINLKKLIKSYENINSLVHPKRDSEELDISAWKYAIDRLPANICKTYIYIISTSLPEIYSDKVLTNQVETKSRLRIIYQLSSGKNFVVVRDLVSDINDFLLNLCIHLIESKKLRHKLKTFECISEFFNMNKLEVLPLTEAERIGLSKIWGEQNVMNVVKRILVNHEDCKISINVPRCQIKQSPIELWTQEVWRKMLVALDVNCLSVIEAIEEGLVVDFMQGSTRSILNGLSPYIIKHEEEIRRWFESNKPKLKSSDYHHPADILIAMSYHYFKNFPEKIEERFEFDRQAGIITDDESYNTGVKIIVINLSRLKNKNLKIVPKSNMHVLLYIGFTFGRQAYDVLKNVNLLLGKALNSFTIIGKAGGLSGFRNDILVATQFLDESKRCSVKINSHGISQSILQKETDSIVRFGPMLTVSGTIMQNTKMLLYYKHIEGCVGVEMEGAHMASCIKDSIEEGIIREDANTRFIYYVEDLPLSGSASVAENYNWDEGFKSMNGIIRYVISLINKKFSNDFTTDIQVKLNYICKSHDNIVVIGTNNDHNNVFNHNVAAQLAENLIEMHYSIIYLTPTHGVRPFMRKVTDEYLEEFGMSSEDIESDLKKYKKFVNKNKLLVIEYKNYVEYINKLQCIAEIAEKYKKIAFLFTDTPGNLELVKTIKETSIVQVNKKFRTIKTICPSAVAMLFRTDLDNGVFNQNTLLLNYRVDYIFTKYKEIDRVDFVTPTLTESLLSSPSVVVQKILNTVNEIDWYN